jgi:hypothetical protein
MSPSVVAAPEWITISSGRVAFAKANAAEAFPPGAGSAGGVAIAKTEENEKVRQKGNQRSLGDTADNL